MQVIAHATLVPKNVVVVVVFVVVVLTLTLVKHLKSPWSHKGAGALGRPEKPNEIKIRPGNTTLSHLKRTIRRTAHK